MRLLLVMLVAAATLTAPAAAAEQDQLNRLIDGPFTGGGTVDFVADPSCGPVSQQTYEYGSGRSRDASGDVQVVVCIHTSTFPYRVTGSFVITSGTGATLRGTLEGTTTTGAFSGTYTVTGGTKRFRTVSGTIAYSATFSLDGERITDIQGTFIGALHR